MEGKKAAKKSKLKSKRRNVRAEELTKGQKQHLKDFGELHPVDEDSGEDEEEDNVKRRKTVERIIDESMRKPRKHAKQHVLSVEETQPNDEDEDIDEDENNEISPYHQLVSSFGNSVTSRLPELNKKIKQSKKTLDLKPLSTNEYKEGQLKVRSNRKKLKEMSQEDSAVTSEDEKDDENFELEEEEEVEVDDGEESLSNDKLLPSDPFSLHFEHDLSDNIIQRLENAKPLSEKPIKSDLKSGTAVHYPSLPELNHLVSTVSLNSGTTPEKLWVKAKLCKNWQNSHNNGSDGSFTEIQQQIFPTINAYQDLLHTNRTFATGDEIREMYCLHALNHVLKTRSRILKNNSKTIQAQKEKKQLPGEQRDHGLTRPKVLILVPFRDCALQIVNIFLKLLVAPGEGQVMNKKRFFEEFGETDKTDDNTAQNKPDDFNQTFSGNTDDFFRVGLVVMRKAIKLFTEFYSSDIIIASPVGLRAIIGAEGEKKRDYDFLSSIELLILDQADVFLMQNWEHVQHIFDHLHLQPKESHDVDFSRVRVWNLNGWSKFYRQTLVFSGFMSPEFNFIFNKHCSNYSGKTKILASNDVGSVCQVIVQIPQVFHRVTASSHKEIATTRFDFFINKVFPDLKGTSSGFGSHTAIFVSSYFDFVRLRNYLKKEEIEFLQLSEYTTRANISRSRTSFLNGEKPLLLFTERFYFYYRYRIRGIRNIVFYELPYYPQFYSEIVNYMDTSSLESGSQTNATSSTVLYSKFDAHKLSRVVGSQRCQQMLTSQQTVHMFVTGDEN